MKNILLHACCAPCSAAVVEWLLQNDYSPTLFFYNPNIYPQEEYETRKAELSKYAQKLNLSVIDGDYTHDKWLCAVKGLEQEPERGSRCFECFKERLVVSAHKATETGISLFTTTLASSRWKNLEQISQAGKWAAAQVPSVEFWDKNWRKDGLQQRRSELLQANKFYNQRYCGCEFSFR
ncbi:MAG: epoxyqueuosine reductase QueH [Prevotellaceae bacterium]|jgi:predicted adenine nucleotide alpha hydrolase (AANH) superfamily ATPase|nr:epoxyqueuosine reductase QueH [Prevotellaceae bacterium]